MNKRLERIRPLGLKEQIKGHLRLLIHSGELAPGCALPSARDMAQTWKVNRNTAWSAYRELAREGLLIIKRGSGTFVAPDASSQGFSQLNRIMEKALKQAAGLGFSAGEARGHFLDYLAAMPMSVRGRKVLVVECNQETLDYLADSLERELEVQTHKVLIQELEEAPDKAARLADGVDLVVCGFNHLEEFQRAVPDSGAAVVPVVLEPDLGLMRELMSLPKGSSVGFTCANARSTENLYKHQVFSSGRSLKRILAGSDRPAELKKMLAGCKVIFASFVVYDRIKEMAGPDQRVIKVEAPVNPGSIAMVREALLAVSSRSFMSDPELVNWEDFLDSTLAKYERWQDEGKITNTSKVIPVERSLEALPWVMPMEQVFMHLKNSRSFALAQCQCRSLGGHCQAPREVCFTLNDISDQWVNKGRARRVSLDEARERLESAAEHGLVHMTLYDPTQHLMAVCSCCPCCCHDLQFFLKQGRQGLVARSDYAAQDCGDECLGCGECVERCIFGARVLGDEGVRFDPQACYGCGLCVGACPVGAISMVPRAASRKTAGLQAR